MLLIDFLRDELGLTGAHIGCTHEGRCGACTVVVDGNAIKSCMMLAVQVDGCSVVTVGGLRALPPNLCTRFRKPFGCAMVCNADIARQG